MIVSFYTRAWLLLIPLIPSMIVSVFNLYHLLSNRILRNALNNHAIICLLFSGFIIQLTDIIWNIYYNFTQIALSSTPIFCIIWVYISTVLIVTIYFLMTWASIERHILIFYSNYFATKRKRIFFHYLPLSICFIWPTLFYTVMFLILPCDIPFSYHIRLCNRYSCITRIEGVSLWDSTVHLILPPFIVAFSSVTLFIRVLYQRHRTHQRIDWRNYKKLAGQLLPISFVYIVLGLPPMAIYVAYSFGLSRSVATDYYSYSMFFAYWSILFTPFASVISLPGLRVKCETFELFTVFKIIIMDLRIIGIVILAVVMDKVCEEFVVFVQNAVDRHKQITNVDDTTTLKKTRTSITQ
ncbi:unnamed protein product [Adineta steineri]|uniref:G-protein coupled receptors family 1 profile domain-containing protein n=1 Tax=Adineta steineri TaxID=433720 RepID=A0A815RXH8_9BILA|nr:unnamed protein product [Adineta steineri]